MSAGRLLPFVALAWASAAAGQEITVLPPTRNVDFFQGPVVSSHRVVGLGGAYTGIAYGADGHLVNPAAFALRDPFGADGYFDWDLALSWLNVSGRDADLTQSGRGGSFEQVQFIQGGGNVKLGRHGFGVHLIAQRWTVFVEVDGEPVSAHYQQTFGGPGYAYNFAGGEFVCGVVTFAGKAALEIDGDDVAGVEGAGLLLGCVWGPFDEAWRLGATLRTPVVGANTSGDEEQVGAVIPDGIAVPAELAWGISWMFGDRRYNVRPTFGYVEDPPPRGVAREYVLVSADVVLTGAVPDGYGIEAFLQDDLQRSGENATIGLRLGAESEVVPDWVTARAGTYYEPSRFDRSSGRVHGTFGADVKAPIVWDFRLSTSADVSASYFNWGVGLGLWH